VRIESHLVAGDIVEATEELSDLLPGQLFKIVKEGMHPTNAFRSDLEFHTGCELVIKAFNPVDPNAPIVHRCITKQYNLAYPQDHSTEIAEAIADVFTRFGQNTRIELSMVEA
jgi:hypothetical protein